MVIEIEVKILEIDKEKVMQTLRDLGAEELEEILIEERAFDFSDNSLIKKRAFLRVRKKANKTSIDLKTSKNKEWGEGTFQEAEEIEFDVSDSEKAKQLFLALGLKQIKHRQKNRKTFKINTKDIQSIIDIDTFPNTPTYMEVEGSKENIIKTLKLLGYSLEDTCSLPASKILEHHGKNPDNIFFEKK
ncbi:CYTH domain-containing protein [archaeon]|nr:CYTH domain-containing protein [archaeon]MBT6697839.1 CYTH domain-containing protein [archaeon]